MGEVKAKTTRIGSDKICPDGHHCWDSCEWNDGEGCAIWRLVKAAEHIVRDFQDFQRSDSK
jgi:hypothetical protein